MIAKYRIVMRKNVNGIRLYSAQIFKNYQWETITVPESIYPYPQSPSSLTELTSYDKIMETIKNQISLDNLEVLQEWDSSGNLIENEE